MSAGINIKKILMYLKKLIIVNFSNDYPFVKKIILKKFRLFGLTFKKSVLRTLTDTNSVVPINKSKYDRHYLSNMASRRNSVKNLNFRSKLPPESQKLDARGSRPLPNPITIKEALFTFIIDVFRKILFANTNIKVGIYLGGLFLSFIFDFLPFPKTYLSRSDNIFNLYFVKIGWLWTLLLTTPFVYLTSFTYCCGKIKLVCMHLSRLLIATAVWFIFTKSFAFIEENFGKCSLNSATKDGKRSCLSKGHFWYSLDISGHTFILIWSTLVITEEAKAIIGWDQVNVMIQNEEHLRLTNDFDIQSGLRLLSDEEFHILKSSYNKFTFYVKGLFVALTALTILWDLMVVTTILYFHIMVEKLIGGIFAVLLWYVTYRYWYAKSKLLPKSPGEGCFKYNKIKMSALKPKVSNATMQSSVSSITK